MYIDECHTYTYIHMYADLCTYSCIVTHNARKHALHAYLLTSIHYTNATYSCTHAYSNVYDFYNYRIVGLTADTGTEASDLCRTVGMTDVLYKPCTASVMSAFLRKVATDLQSSAPETSTTANSSC
jgi:hypothetical protein